MKKFAFLLLIISSLISLSISAQNCSIKGVVKDADNNEPIPFANILVKGTQTGATSDIEGNFLIENVPCGFIQLQVSYVGYKPYISSEIITSSNKIPFIEIMLQKAVNELKEVVIKADPFEKKEESAISMISIGVKEIETNPGSNRDISRVIQSFPGVGSTPAFRNDVIIRGGGPSENRFFLDDVEIPVINHFATQGASGGPVGIINADFIEKVDFYSSAFPATRYNALSGILDFKLKEGNKDKLSYQFTIGASETAFTIDGPLSENSNFIFSVRRSYLQFLFSAIGLPFLPTFNDYQLKYKMNINKKSQFTLISLGSLDNLKLNTNIKNPTPSQEYILSQIPVNNQWSYTIGGVYKRFFDNGFHTFVLSRNMLNNEFYKYPDNDESKNKVFDYNSQEQENKFRYDLNLRKNSRKYLVSANMEYANYYNYTNQQVTAGNQIFNIQYETDLNLIKYGLGLQAVDRFVDGKLLVSAGVRFDGTNYNKQTANLINQTSPRVSASYALSDKWQIKAGTGRFFQLPAYTTLGFKINNAYANKQSAKYIGLNQFNIGFETRIKESILFSFEAFYKDYFNYPIDTITGISIANQGAAYSSVSGTVPAVFSGKGKAYGFEILNRWNKDNLTVLATYTYVRSLFTDLQGEYHPSSWDARHLLTITGTRQFNKNWRFGLKFRFVGGLPYTPYDLENSSLVNVWNINGGPVPDYSKINSERLPGFHQLDIRIDKNFYFKKWTLMLYLDIQNLYNLQYKNQDFVVRKKDENGNYITEQNGNKYVLEKLPNTTGTVLPTVGIRIRF